jgi:hypothetical protein
MDCIVITRNVPDSRNIKRSNESDLTAMLQPISVTASTI